MTVVVADTSPINYLILIGEIGVLQRLYHRVVIPEEVFSELMDTGAPPAFAIAISKPLATRQDLSLRRPDSDHRPAQSPSRQTVRVALATFQKRRFTAN